MTMLGSEAFEHITSHSLCAGFEATKLHRTVIGHAQRRERSRQRALSSADLRAVHVLALERGSVLAHETFTPRDASEIEGHAQAAKPQPARDVGAGLLGAVCRWA